MKELITVFLAVIYVVSSFLFTVDGMMNANFYPNECKKERRIYYVFPSYKLGCWLGEDIKK